MNHKHHTSPAAMAAFSPVSSMKHAGTSFARTILLAGISLVSLTGTAWAQVVGSRLQLGELYTFQSASDPKLYISHGALEANMSVNPKVKQFKVVAPLNGKPGFVSLQAVEFPGNNYVVMSNELPVSIYKNCNYYKVSSQPSPDDAVFNEKASFEVMAGRSNGTDPSLVSFRVKGGLNFFKREQGVFCDAPGAGVAPQYQNHFTWRVGKPAPAKLPKGTEMKEGEKMLSANGEFSLEITGGKLVIFNKARQSVWEAKNDPRWEGRLGYKMKVQADGNLGFYSKEDGYLWDAGVLSGDRVVLENDGRLVLYNTKNEAVWSSK